MFELVPWLLIVVLFLGLIISLIKLKELRKAFQIELSRKVAEIRLQLTQESMAKLEREREQLLKMFEQRLEEWKRKEMENAVKVELEKWAQKMEDEIRRDAIKKSITTLLGKVSEHIAPLYMARELDIDPRDLRFIGTPVDYIAFKGLSSGNPEKILFIEVKASQSGTLTERERSIRTLIESKKVEWITFNIRKEVEKAFEIIERELTTINVKPEIEKPPEKPTQQIGAMGEDDEFYEWLVSEFQITREEYEELDNELKSFLRREYESSRAK